MGNEEALIAHLHDVTGLDSSVLAKILSEVKSWYPLDLRSWIMLRHKELRAQKMRNRDIYAQIREELARILVHPSPLSERQIRRMIYG